MRNELTPEKKIELTRIALKLPKVLRLNSKGRPVPSMKRLKIRGERLMLDGVKTVRGFKVDPKKFYRIRKPVTINHYENLCQAYQRRGDEGVKAYIQQANRAWYRQQPFAVKWKVFVEGIRVFFRQLVKKKPEGQPPVSGPSK